MNYSSDNIKGILMPDKLKYLYALQLLEDEEYTLDGMVQSCYACDGSDIDIHIVNIDDVSNFLMRTDTDSPEIQAITEQVQKEYHRNNMMGLSKGKHITIEVCKDCNTVLKVGHHILFEHKILSPKALEDWGIIRLNGSKGTFIDGKDTFSWRICPHCGDIVYSCVNFDGLESKQCRTCRIMIPDYTSISELKKYV